MKFESLNLPSKAEIITLARVSILIAFGYMAGNGIGYRNALENGDWHCIPKDSEMKIYRDKPQPE